MQEDVPPPSKRPKASETSSAQRSGGSTSVRLGAPRQPSQAVEADLLLLEALEAKRHDDLRKDIMSKIQNHQNWNRNHVDLTKGPLSPVSSPVRQPFRAAQAQYLLTPPASSASQESLEEPEPMDLDEEVPSAMVKFQGAPIDENSPPQLVQYRFRRRIGRLNRLWIDRRPAVKAPSAHNRDSDRWNYDQSDSEDEQDTYYVDPYDTRCIRFRATIPLTFESRPRHPRPPALVQAQAAAQQAAAQAAANGQWQPQGSSKPTAQMQKQDP